MDDECDCPQCGERPDLEYLWQFFQWVYRIDPSVVEAFEASQHGENELSLN